MEHLDKPLAYWALPTDRRLPLAFLSRPLRELLDASFEELAQTPGIGQKKMKSFVKLLARVANTDPADLPTEINDFYLGLKNSAACDTNNPDKRRGPKLSLNSNGNNGARASCGTVWARKNSATSPQPCGT